MVSTQALTMLCATPHRTAENRLDDPTPKILPEITCVVETGIPKWLAVKMTAAADVSAANPCTGSRRMILWPIVLMIRQPPADVPAAIATAHASTTHDGTTGCFRSPWLTSASVMIPMLF